MQTTPRNGDESESASTKPDDNARPKKTRPPVEIDLPAESAREMEAEKAEPAAAPAGEPRLPEQPAIETQPPPAPAKPAMAMPLLLALVAGIAGSLGVEALLGGSDPKLNSALDQRLARLEQVKPPTAPALPAELTDRLAKAEKALAEVAPREQALQAEIMRLASQLKTLAERPVATGSPSAGPAPETTAEFERLRGAVEAATKQAEEQIARFTGLNDQIATLAKAVASANGELARASAAAVVSQNLAESFQRHEALGGAIEALKALGVAADRLAPLAAYAQNPPPSLAGLGTELRDLAKASAEAGTGQQGDFLSRLRQGAASLVEVRRTGEITGTDDAAHLARAEQALGRGDLLTAITLVGRLSAPRAERFAGWKAKAEARAKADAAIRQIRQESLAGLARAAAPAKP
ncbi:MAG: hypothetical protein IOC35_12195 [Methylobacterium sp.]|jgi:hypothetical protein|nr:hypothetical protein [Methylobacterium sp.]